MKITISKQQIRIFFKCLPLVLLSTLASLGMLLPSIVYFIIVIFLGVQVILAYKRSTNWMALMCVLLMLFFYFRNNANIRLNSIAYMWILLCFPICLLFASQGGYINLSWMSMLMNLLRPVYCFYALFTIAMAVNGGLVSFVCRIFPNYQDTILKQYNSAGIPGLTHHYSTNGMLLAIGTIIFGSYAITRKKRRDLFFFLILTGALLLSGKRAHVIFGLTALYCSYYIYNSDKKKSRLWKGLGVLLGSGCLYVVASYFVPAFSNIITRFVDSADQGDLTLGRTAVWGQAILMFKQHPVFGMGWEQYVHQGGWLWNIHNIYIQLIIETGMIGFVVYLLWFAYNLFVTWKLYKYARDHNGQYDIMDLCFINYSLAMQILFMLYGFTGNPLYDKEMYVPYFIACAISVSYRNEKFVNEEFCEETALEK